MPESGQILIETTRTHRQRLGSALAYGPLEERRTQAVQSRRFGDGRSAPSLPRR